MPRAVILVHRYGPALTIIAFCIAAASPPSSVHSRAYTPPSVLMRTQSTTLRPRSHSVPMPRTPPPALANKSTTGTHAACQHLPPRAHRATHRLISARHPQQPSNRRTQPRRRRRACVRAHHDLRKCELVNPPSAPRLCTSRVSIRHSSGDAGMHPLGSSRWASAARMSTVAGGEKWGHEGKKGQDGASREMLSDERDDPSAPLVLPFAAHR